MNAMTNSEALAVMDAETQRAGGEAYQAGRDLIEARAHFAALITRNAELEADAARLDWLDANGFTAYRAIDPIDGLSDHCVVVRETQKPRRGIVADAIRDAIDAARGAA